MGRAILAPGILSILVPVESARAKESRPGKGLAYDGLQGLLEGVAMGIKEKQLEVGDVGDGQEHINQEDGAHRAGKD
jgi:hypothetical protein